MENRIRQLRKELNLTQEELGKALGIQKSAVAKYEKGRTENIKTENLRKLKDIFNCSSDYILGFSEIRNIPEDLVGKYINLPATAQTQAKLYIDKLSHLYPTSCDIIENGVIPIAAHDDNDSPENIRRDIEKALEFIDSHRRE